MNKIMKLCTSIFVIVMFYSCNQDIDRFDNADNYIYFNMPFVLNQYGKETSVRQDSLSYSFALVIFLLPRTCLKFRSILWGLLIRKKGLTGWKS